MLSMVHEALTRSADAIVMMFLVSFVLAVFFGSIIFFVEKGNYTVNSMYLNGYYEVISANRINTQKSSFSSVLDGMYFVFFTLTRGKTQYMIGLVCLDIL